MKHSNTPKTRRGFTIMEMMIALSTIAIIATTSLQVASRITQKAESAKLDSDMKVLNSAATIYQKFGGDLSEAADSNRVLQKLITIANSEYADRIPGLSGSMIDPRLRGIKQTEAEADSNQERILWNKDLAQFEKATSGPAGIKEFILDDSYVHEDLEEDRDFAMLYSDDSGWLWSYQEKPTKPIAPPTMVMVYSEDIAESNSSGVPEIEDESGSGRE